MVTSTMKSLFISAEPLKGTRTGQVAISQSFLPLDVVGSNGVENGEVVVVRARLNHEKGPLRRYEWPGESQSVRELRAAPNGQNKRTAYLEGVGMT